MSGTSNVRSMAPNHRPLNVLRCKVVLVGDACCGKTALTQVFCSGGATYPKNYLMTVGAELSVKQVPIPNTSTVVELFLFDCAGQSVFNQVEMNAKYVSEAYPALSRTKPRLVRGGSRRDGRLRHRESRELPGLWQVAE